MNNDKEVFNSRICTYCTKRDKCDKNKFTVFVYNEKVTMRCSGYDYELKDQILVQPE